MSFQGQGSNWYRSVVTIVRNAHDRSAPDHRRLAALFSPAMQAALHGSASAMPNINCNFSKVRMIVAPLYRIYLQKIAD